MDLNHDSATERYTETLTSALTYFSSLAQSSSGWKRLSSASVRPNKTGSSGSPGSAGRSGTGATSSTASSPVTSRHNEDILSNLPGGASASSAASAAIESLLPAITVSKKSVPGKSAEIVRASIVLPGLNEQTDLEDWRAVLECSGARKIWDPMVESSNVLMTLDDSTCITKTIFKTTWPASPRDALLIETTLLDHNAVLHIATSIKPSHDDPIFLRPSPPHVRAYLPLVAWHIQLVPADMDDTVSFTSFNSLTASQNKPVMPRHSIRVSFYYQIDMRGWAVNSSVSMQSHVPSCIANVYRLLRRQGVPPHVSRHSPRIQLDLNEYDPATGIYELRYDVIPSDSEDLLLGQRTVSSALKRFRLGGAAVEEGPELGNAVQDSSSIPQELVLSDDEGDDLENNGDGNNLQQGYVDVELDGEKWGLGSDIVVHIFMNDIEDEEFVQEHVECLKYMGRDRYILRMKHTETGPHHGAINVKLRIERIPQETSGSANLLSHQQLRFQRQQQERENEQQQQNQQGQGLLPTSDLNNLSVSVNGQEKNILPFHRSSIPPTKRLSMSLQEQLELSQQIVQEVDTGPSHWQSGSDGLDGQEVRTTASPLLLMSSSMPTTMQNLNRSNQSIMSNGTSTMQPGNTNPSKVNSSYGYFNSLVQEPATSWKPLSKQRGVQISKLEIQGHAPGIVKGEGIFEDYTIWDIKAVLDCPSARKIWDKMFDESHMLQHATPSSILSYVRFKGFWPASPKDMAVLNTTFITKDAIHFFATSVDDTNLYPAIPPPVSPFVRSELVVSGWYLQTVKPKSVRIVYIAQAAPTGWMVPGTALGAMATEMPLCVAEIIKYLETYGSPPTLVSIRRGRALGIEYSHEKSSFRLEYVQDSNPIFSGHRQSLQQQHQHHQSLSAERQRRSTVDLTAGVGSGDPQQFGSPKLGPTDKLLAEIRLDARVWARNGDCDITIDPPPSKVSCSSVLHDGTGYRLRIEHSSGRAVPAGGKVLLMARKPTKPGCGIVVNGVPINMPSMEHLLSWMPHHTLLTDKDKSQAPLSVDGTLAEKESQVGDEDESGEKAANGTGENGQTSEPGMKRGPSTLMSPLQYAQGAMDLLSKINSDPEDSWTVVSDSKGGMKVTKRFMPSEISDQVPLVRGEKVIEGFSLEEIATVIGTLGTRSKLDDLYESGEMLESFGAGCSTFHHVLKSYFPLPLPARDLFFVTATAFAEASARRPQIVIISTSIPHGGASKATDEASTSTSTPPQSRPRAHLHLSAWILEGIDPYSSNHPIPSTRVTFMTALDLGGSVPQRISGMIQTMFPKMITQVESYLQAQAAPPIIRIPEQMIVGESSLVVEPATADENPPQLPPILPWIKPANRIVSWDFKMKDYYCELILLFDQFRLNPSRLDLATEIRAKKSKKAKRKSKQHINKSGSPEQNELDQDQEEQTTKDESAKVKSRTVMELVVDLKQYPMGYNIITNIKVDPELLLQHKQQRDSGLKQAMSSSISAVKLTGSTSSPGTAAASPAASKFIGGFDSNGKGSLADLNGRSSIDGDGVFHKSMSSEAATSGTGIAAVLGSSANVPRALPSSTSLIRILPPAVTVNIIDIPPAPSHSSSLSGVSKRRKHLIVITVPEAESSASYLQSLQQAAAAPLALKSAAPHAISGATAKPVVTASSVAGTTSTMFPDSDRMEYRQSRHLTSSSSSQELGSTTEATRPAFSPGKLATPEPGVKQQQEQQQHPQQVSSSSEPPMPEVETRVFQFGVKIDRLQHKDLDHQALKEAKENPKTSPDEQEWLGRVMVDGMPVKVVTSWTRHELGFLDGMMEDLDDPQDGRGSRRKKSSSRRKSYNSAEQDEGSDLKSADSMDDERSRRDAEDEGAEQERRGSRTVSRRRKHHRQQLGLLAGPHGPESDSAFNNHNGRSFDPNLDGARPTSTLTGFSGFLMSVGLLGSNGSKGSQGDGMDGTLDEPDAGSNENSRRESALEYDDLDDDRTIRASKSTSRGGISGILNGAGSRGKAKGRDRKHDDHDLDLESLHGSIVFNDRGDDTDQGGYSHRSGDDLPRSTQYSEDENRGSRATDKDISDWARESGTVRRRKGRSALRPQDKDLSPSRPSLDIVRPPRESREPIESGGPDSEVDSKLAHRRRNSRSSASKYQRSRIVHASSTSATARRTGSTNGADHPRFRGSLLYAYTFRNMVWSAIAFFLIGMLLRVYVIGPSFLKTANSNIGGGGVNSGPSTTTTYYYYYRAAAPTGYGSTGGLLKSTSPSRSLLPVGGGGGSGRQESGYEEDRGEGAAGGGMDSSVWPQGIQEVFTVRRILGWDFVLLAYPSQDLQQQQSSSSSRSSPS